MSQATSSAKAALTVMVSEAEQAALDRFRIGRDPAMTRAEALRAILAEWREAEVASRGGGATDEGLRPSELNASNDI